MRLLLTFLTWLQTVRRSLKHLQCSGGSLLRLSLRRSGPPVVRVAVSVEPFRSPHMTMDTAHSHRRPAIAAISTSVRSHKVILIGG